ncbi:hypothetical protein IWZ00DRAFT_521206 [Phyllosticta capitalensis]|uniref:Uncharacterized protein n=1 Tax=Phyllosticta capitalensis TaxID=121624 RepID=A0ABR1YD62_9PEZI
MQKVLGTMSLWRCLTRLSRQRRLNTSFRSYLWTASPACQDRVLKNDSNGVFDHISGRFVQAIASQFQPNKLTDSDPQPASTTRLGALQEDTPSTWPNSRRLRPNRSTKSRTMLSRSLASRKAAITACSKSPCATVSSLWRASRTHPMEQRHLLVANEVATLDYYLRLHGFPRPAGLRLLGPRRRMRRGHRVQSSWSLFRECL